MEPNLPILIKYDKINSSYRELSTIKGGVNE